MYSREKAEMFIVQVLREQDSSENVEVAVLQQILV